jgi:protein SCO1/2
VARLPAIVIAGVLLGSTVPLHAAVTRQELSTVDATPRPGSKLPLGLPLQGEDGTTKSLLLWLGAQPSVWVLADYTCKSLCGPVISIVSDALAHSGLRSGADFRLIVVGLDPKDTATDAAAMKRAQVNDGVAATSYFLRGNPKVIANLTTAFGFKSVYDRDHDQFAHPAAAFVVTPDGRVGQALPGLAVDPTNIRLALLAAGNGSIGSWTDHIRLLCYAYDPATGVYTVAIGRILSATGATTMAALALLIGSLLWRDYRA